MKKIISMVLTIAILFSMTAAYVSADSLVSYETDFETAESYSWANNYNSGYSGTKTVAYGSNSYNTAWSILHDGSTAGKFGSTSGALTNVTGTSVFSLDFMIDGTKSNALSGMVWTTCLRLYASDGTELNMFLERRNNGKYKVLVRKSGASDVYLENSDNPGSVDVDTWSRLIVAYTPSTGKADLYLIRNIDKPAQSDVQTVAGYQLTEANADTGLNRIHFYQYDAKVTETYFDNVVLKQVNEFLTQTAATPANGATEAATDSEVSFTFNNDIASANLKVNDAAASFAISGNTVTYSDTLADETTYTVTGFVTDVYGQVLVVNHSFTTAAAAEEPPVVETRISHETGFESGEAESYSKWADGSDGTTATLAYGSNTNNTAYMLSSGKKFGSVSYANANNLKQNPITGLSIFAYDFYPVGDSFTDDANYTAYKFGQIYPDAADINTKDYYVWGLIRRGNQIGIAAMCDYDNQEVSRVDFDTWTRLILVYNPATGLGDFTVIKNVDTENAEATTLAGVQVTAADLTKIDRFYVRSQSTNSIYIDNVTIGQIPAVLAQTAATPANGATEVATDSEVSFTFNNDIASANLKVNDAAASFAVSGNTVTYSDTLADETTYTVTGHVTDAYGVVQAVNHSFTTVAASGGDTPGEDTTHKYEADFEDDSYTSWGNLTTKSTADMSQVVTKAYGSKENNKVVALKSGNPYANDRGSFDTLSYGTVVENPILGNCILTFDFNIDSSSNTSWDAPRAINAVNVQIKGISSYDKTLFKYQKMDDTDYRVLLGDDTLLGSIALDTWNRLTMAYNPATGKADFALITNVDTATPELYTVPDFQLTAGGDVGIDRLQLPTLYNDLLFYYDNIELREQATLLTYGNARFVDGSDNEITDGKSVAAPVFKADVTNNTDAPEKVTVVVTATKNGRIEEISTKTVAVAAGESATVSNGLEMADASGYEVKGFIIRLQNIKSLVNAITLEAN